MNLNTKRHSPRPHPFTSNTESSPSVLVGIVAPISPASSLLYLLRGDGEPHIPSPSNGSCCHSQPARAGCTTPHLPAGRAITRRGRGGEPATGACTSLMGRGGGVAAGAPPRCGRHRGAHPHGLCPLLSSPRPVQWRLIPFSLRLETPAPLRPTSATLPPCAAATFLVAAPCTTAPLLRHLPFLKSPSALSSATARPTRLWARPLCEEGLAWWQLPRGFSRREESEGEETMKMG